MTFTRPIRKGVLVAFTSRVVLTGETKIVSCIEVHAGSKLAVRGFITFIHVDLDGKPIPHGINLLPETEKEKVLYEEAKALT